MGHVGGSLPRCQRVRSLRDNQLSRGERTCVSGRFRTILPASGGPKTPLRRRVALPPAYQEHPVLLRDHDYSRGGGSDEWIAIHSNGIHTYPLEWTAAWIGLDWYPMHWNPLHTNAIHPRPRRRPDTRPGKRINESRGAFTTIPVTPQNTRR